MSESGLSGFPDAGSILKPSGSPGRDAAKHVASVTFEGPAIETVVSENVSTVSSIFQNPTVASSRRQQNMRRRASSVKVKGAEYDGYTPKMVELHHNMSRLALRKKAESERQEVEDRNNNRDDDDVLEDSPDFTASLRRADADLTCCQWMVKPLRKEALRHSSFYVFSSTFKPRLFIANVVHHKIFEAAIIILILANCITLALDDPTKDKQEHYQYVADIFFLVVFSIEMVLKMFALGVFMHSGSYMRSAWNRLDFIIVVFSYLVFIPGFGNYTAIKTLRVLRPLRSMNAVPQLQVIVAGMLHSVKGLVHVAVLAGFIFAVFGILGVQLWAGLFSNRCVQPVTVPTWDALENVTIVNTTLPPTMDIHVVHPDTFCKRGESANGFLGKACPRNMQCMKTGANPHYGYQNFDHIGWALLTVFQLITLEAWTEVLNITTDVWGQASIIYFVCLIMIGNFFVLNLALAVISEKFSEVEMQKDEETHADASKRMTQANMDDVFKIGLMEMTLSRNPLYARNSVFLTSHGSFRSHDVRSNSQLASMNPGIAAAAGLDASEIGKRRSTIGTAASSEGVASEKQSAVSFTDKVVAVAETIQRYVHLVVAGVFPEEVRCEGAEGIVVDAPNVETNQDMLTPFEAWTSPTAITVNGDMEDFTLDRETTSAGNECTENEKKDPGEGSSLFAKFILVCIIINTIILAMKHHGQPHWMEEFSETSNIVLTVIFGVECVMKIVAYGPVKYFTDAFDVLDFIVVVVSIIEITLSGSSTVSVFRAFRLLRVFKLLDRFRTLRELIQVILSAVKSTGYLSIIVLLYIFIAALVGMQLFGGKLRKAETPDRAVRSTFDSFFKSFVTVFQIMTRDNWHELMWDSMYVTSEAAALYYIALVLVGDILILNLFLAILISAFDKLDVELDDDEEDSTQGHMDAVVTEVNKNRESNKDGRFYKLMRENQLVRMPEGLIVRDPYLEELVTSYGGRPISQVFVAGDVGSWSVSPERTTASQCPVCRYPFARILPPPAGLKGPTKSEVHSRMCATLAARRDREMIARFLLEVVEVCSPRMDEPTEQIRSAIVAQAWGAGLLLHCSLNTLITASWVELQKLLRREVQLLTLRVGEEQVGRSLLAFAGSCFPKHHQTTGGNALFVFGPDNPVRVFCSTIVAHPMFDKVILVFIIISSVLLAVDNPRDPEGTTLKQVLLDLDIVFTSIFIAECLMKVVSWGFLFPETAYLRDPWNGLDFVIVLISVVSLSMTDVDISFLKVFRAFRALRPLRFINRNHGLKMVVATLLRSVKGIANVALITALIFLVFAIMGVELFSGKFYRCSDGSDVDRTVCLLNGERWVTAPQNFDNVFESLLTLFEVAAMEFWVDIMWNAVDGVSHDVPPRRDNNIANALFFIVFIVVGAFFLLNMFVGVVIHNFNVVKTHEDGLLLLTEDQKLWVETHRLLLNFRPSPKMTVGANDSLFVRAAGRVANHQLFEPVVAVVIILNIVALGAHHDGMTPEVENFINIADYIFSAIFIVEAVVKLMAFGKRYFMTGWNRFDFFLVVLSVIGIATQQAAGSGLPVNVGIIRVFRIFRIMRILRLIKQARDVQILLETLWYSLPQLGNIGAFLLLLFFIYAVLGVQLFANVQYGETYDSHADFRSFPSAFFLLFRFATVTDWNGVMRDCMVQAPDCPPGECGYLAAPAYFISFMLLAAFVMTNLFVAVVLDNFNTTMRLNKSDLTVSDLHKFVDLWSEFDPDAKLTIPTDQFPVLLAKLKPPLGITRQASRLELLHCSTVYRIPEHAGVIHFVETLIPLARCVLGAEFGDKAIREQEEQWLIVFPDILRLPIIRFQNRRATLDLHFASTFIAAAFKRREARKLVGKLRAQHRQDIVVWHKEHATKTGHLGILEKVNRSFEHDDGDEEGNDHVALQPSSLYYGGVSSDVFKATIRRKEAAANKMSPKAGAAAARVEAAPVALTPLVATPEQQRQFTQQLNKKKLDDLKMRVLELS